MSRYMLDVVTSAVDVGEVLVSDGGWSVRGNESEGKGRGRMRGVCARLRMNGPELLGRQIQINRP
jgi:hypothetical protein